MLFIIYINYYILCFIYKYILIWRLMTILKVTYANIETFIYYEYII